MMMIRLVSGDCLLGAGYASVSPIPDFASSSYADADAGAVTDGGHGGHGGADDIALAADPDEVEALDSYLRDALLEGLGATRDYNPSFCPSGRVDYLVNHE